MVLIRWRTGVPLFFCVCKTHLPNCSNKGLFQVYWSIFGYLLHPSHSIHNISNELGHIINSVLRFLHLLDLWCLAGITIAPTDVAALLIFKAGKKCRNFYALAKHCIRRLAASSSSKRSVSTPIFWPRRSQQVFLSLVDIHLSLHHHGNGL